MALLLSAILPSDWGPSAGPAGRRPDKGLQTLISQSVFFALLLVALYLLVSVRYAQPFWRSMGWVAAGARSLVVRRGRAGSGAGGGDRWECCCVLPKFPDPVKGLITGRASLAIVMLFAVALGPIYEELFFRGFLFPLLAKILRSGGGGPVERVTLRAAARGAISMGLAADYTGGNRRRGIRISCATGPARPRRATILHGCFNLTQFVAFLLLRG